MRKSLAKADLQGRGQTISFWMGIGFWHCERSVIGADFMTLVPGMGPTHEILTWNSFLPSLAILIHSILWLWALK